MLSPGLVTTPITPTSEEVLVWAYTNNGEPEPDWDLNLAVPELVATLLKISFDSACQQRWFALHCLYLLSADESIVQGTASTNLGPLESSVAKALQSSDVLLRNWARRTIKLLQGEIAFNYNLWCCQGYINADRRTLG